MRCVYVLRNLTNEKVYVGQTKNPAIRKAGHFYEARKGNERPLYRSIRKHGAENFSFEVIEECDDAVINEREQFWVAHFDSFNPEKGYNLTNGGSQYFLHSEETKRLMSQNHVGMKRRLHSLETINKMRQTHTGRQHSAKTRSLFRSRRLSVETKTKISQTLKGKYLGKNSPNYGRICSLETKQRLSQAHQKNPKCRREIARKAGQASAAKSRIELSSETVELILQLSATLSIRAISRKLEIKHRYLISKIIREKR